MGSGAIYAVIVALWAVVLIPMWLRRHDEANESRSVDRYRGAMRSLSRRTGSSTREVLMPAGDRGSVEISVKGSEAPTTRSAPSRTAAARRSVPAPVGAGSVPPSVRAARAKAAARRRRVLLVLGVLLVLDLALVLLGRVPTWSLALPVLLLVGFVVAARRSLRLQADLDARLARGARLRDHAEQAEADVARRSRRRTSSARSAQRADAAAATAVLVDEVDDEGWDAVSEPLPTYVTAPTASRVPRVIDLTTPGHWGGAAMVEQVQRDRAAADEAFFDQTVLDAEPAAAAEAGGSSFAERFVDDEVALGVDDDSFFDQMDRHHPRAVND